MKKVILEISLDSVESAIAAQQGGADRIEVCSVLSTGGITPSLGLIRTIRSAVTIPVHVIVRPREGDFNYSRLEFECMVRDINAMKEWEIDGIVAGVLTEKAEIDMRRMKNILQAARPMEVIFHRAIDSAADPFRALEEIIDLGAEGVLTSGGVPSAWDGRKRIAEFVRKSDGRIPIMAGSGVKRSNVHQLVAATGCDAVHVGSDVTFEEKKKNISGQLFHETKKIVGKELVEELRGKLGNEPRIVTKTPAQDNS